MTTIALITGANKGIGLETARQLAQQGIYVLIGARDTAKGEAAAKGLQAEGLKADFIPLEMSNEQSVKQAAQRVRDRLVEATQLSVLSVFDCVLRCDRIQRIDARLDDI